jgi:hypothetical protein
MYVVNVETPQPGKARHTHLCSYRSDLKTVRVYVYYISILVAVCSVENRDRWRALVGTVRDFRVP